MLRYVLVLFFLTLPALADSSAIISRRESPIDGPAEDFSPEQLTFDFVSSEGSFWYDCTHEKGQEPHQWVVKCDNYEFHLHLFLREWLREDETTYEFHYWADEVKVLKESHTQSTWLTVDSKAKTKRLIGYLGFQDDSSQLRLEVNMK